MENDIIENLKTLAENLQSAKLGKRGKEAHVNSYIVIDEYHDWRAKSEDFLGTYYEDSHTLYNKFKSMPSEGNGHVLMRYFGQQYPIFKVLINKIEKGEIMNKTSEKNESPELADGTTVFISHSIKDKVIIDAFVDLILHGALSVPINKIFCVSTDGTKIESGVDWRNAIYQNLLSAKINFLIITPNYKESEVCMNEMGAAWVTCAKVLPLIIEPIDYKSVGVIQEPNQIEKLLDEKSLDRIKDSVQQILEIPFAQIKSDRWTAKKNEFLVLAKAYLEENPFVTPMDRPTFNQLIKEKKDLEDTIKYLNVEKTELKALITQLEILKDKKEVDDILKKRKPTVQFQEFLELCKDVSVLLSDNEIIINGIIFKSYSGKNFTITIEGNRNVIDEAFANDFIDEDLDVNWESTTEMRKTKKALERVDKFLLKDLDDDFYESYYRQFDAPVSLSNKKFWEEVFEIAITFS